MSSHTQCAAVISVVALMSVAPQMDVAQLFAAPASGIAGSAHGPVLPLPAAVMVARAIHGNVAGG